MAAASGDDEILLCKLKEFVPEKRPNYIKVTKLNDFSLFVYYRQSANGIRDWLTVTVTCSLWPASLQLLRRQTK